MDGEKRPGLSGQPLLPSIPSLFAAVFFDQNQAPDAAQEDGDDRCRVHLKPPFRALFLW